MLATRIRPAARRLGLIAPLALATALTLAACQPTKPAQPPVPVPGQFIAYYFVLDGPAAQRSSTPFTVPLAGGATASAALASDGSVTTHLSDLAGQANVGFWIIPVRLGDIATIQMDVTLSGDSQSALGLFLDVDGDGDFGTWDGSTVDPGDDLQTVGPIGTDPSVSIDDSTTLTIAGGSTSQATLAQLKAGAVPDVGPNTPAFILGALNLDVPSNDPPADGTATFTSLRLNGVELLVP